MNFNLIIDNMLAMNKTENSPISIETQNRGLSHIFYCDNSVGLVTTIST